MEAAPQGADSTARAGARVLRRLDPATLAVLAALAALGAAWLVWARLTGAPSGGVGWGALDSILAANAGRQIAQPAPTFALADATGQPVDLEDLRGQVVLVNFWATWCVPCRAEMPELNRAAEDYHEAGFRVLAINVLEDADAVLRFGEELKLGLPLLLDGRGDVYRAYNVQALPTSFLIDRDGVIRDVKLGVVTRSYLEGRLPGLLGTEGRS